MNDKFKILSEDHLRGLLDTFIYLFNLHDTTINENYGFGFRIIKIEKTYNVICNWQGEEINVIPATHDDERQSEFKPYEDSFMVLEDYSLDQLEQLITDVLHIVVETELTYK